MNSEQEQRILEATGARSLQHTTTLQSLWSGYGSLDRYHLEGSSITSIIIKHVRLPQQQQHPRGWNTDQSHQRKLRSYQVETAWYKQWAKQCDKYCRVPHSFTQIETPHEFLLVLEDLDSAGFPARRIQPSTQAMHTCLEWLAHFHARFMQVQPTQLWPVGTYWHLETRPDEWRSMPENELKHVATQIDTVLSNTPFQTLVHGDAKLANFCFSADDKTVAAVDFQYVGGGCGMKDVAYFISSCLDEQACELQAPALLAYYFSALTKALTRYQPQLNAEAIKTAWQPLYAVAWADFYRFLQGWNPGHWKMHRYSRSLTSKALRDLG